MKSVAGSGTSSGWPPPRPVPNMPPVPSPNSDWLHLVADVVGVVEKRAATR